MTKALIIDCDASSSRILKRILQKKLFTVDETQDAKKALEMIETASYDVVVMRLEDPDTYDTDTLIFSRKNLSNAARLITIGFPSLQRSINALESGADAVFTRPIEPERFVEVIEKMVRKQPNVLQ